MLEMKTVELYVLVNANCNMWGRNLISLKNEWIIIFFYSDREGSATNQNLRAVSVLPEP